MYSLIDNLTFDHFYLGLLIHDTVSNTIYSSVIYYPFILAKPLIGYIYLYSRDHLYIRNIKFQIISPVICQ